MGEAQRAGRRIKGKTEGRHGRVPYREGSGIKGKSEGKNGRCPKGGKGNKREGRGQEW
jgi:hypothetical protein